jgi:hypothetical protein
LLAVLKNRNTLKGFSVSGSFLTFVALSALEWPLFLLLHDIFVLNLATIAFWFIVRLTLRLKLKKPLIQPSQF